MGEFRRREDSVKYSLKNLIRKGLKRGKQFKRGWSEFMRNREILKSLKGGGTEIRL